MPQLMLHLLGSFQATLDGQPITGFEANKVRALLAYLAVEAHRPHSRDELIGLLWPDQPDATARANLRQALANLRNAIGDRTAEAPFLATTSDSVQFQRTQQCSIDVVVFTELIAACKAHVHRRLETCRSCAQRLQQTVELYRGDFLAQFVQSGSEAFEEWTLIQRERLHRDVLDALYALAEHHDRRSEYDRVRHYAARQLELDPWREEAHRQLMRALALSGQRSAALAQYEKCQRVLAEELGVPPSKETTALFAKIKADELAREERRHNLPAALTPLLGREHELGEIDRLLEMPACRLVTLIGPGGIGKTHLALQAATEHIGAFTHGVYFVSLDSLDVPEYIVTAVAAALQLTFSEQQDFQTQLFDALHDRDVLLVLDNFEHLLEGGTGLIADLLQHAPQVTVLVTSRERLNINGEWILNIGGLRVPPDSVVDQIEDYSAVKLFVQSAQRARAGFAVPRAERSCVVHLCQLVDGMPLALELAAAWTRALSCHDIAQEIESGLAILASPTRDAAERHRSMQVVFEQSWKMLSAEEQRVLRALSVFRGGFERQGAKVVADAALPVLVALIDKSFLHQDEAGRYSMHELVRQYAGEKLREAGEVDEARNRHLAFFLELAETAEPELHGADQAMWLQRLERDHDNLRAALDWGLSERSNRGAGLRLSSALVFFWMTRGYTQEGQNWLIRELAVTGNISTALQARAFSAAGTMAFWQGDYDGAMSFHQDSLTLYRALADQRGVAESLNNLGIQATVLGNLEQAMPFLQESLGISRTLGDQVGIAKALSSLGYVAQLLGKLELAAAHYSESLALYRNLGDLGWSAIALHNLGLTVIQQGHLEQAMLLHKESLRLQQQLGEKQLLPDLFEALADELGAQRRPERAARLLGAAAALREVLHTRLYPVDQPDYERSVAMVRAQLDEATFAAAWAEGQAMTIEQAIGYALNSSDEKPQVT
jgi:predicted ATPase/DNA-binding SARP family transcriptional activator